MILTAHKLAEMMECGRLEPYSDKEGILKLCESARKCGLGVAFANLGYLPLVVKEIEGSQTIPAVPIAFPFGATSPEVKAFETRQVLEAGAREFDMVMSLQRFKSGDYGFVLEDIQAVVEAAGGLTTKVIIETCYLTKPEILKASEIAKQAGAKFIKTSTGYGRYCARLVDIQLIKKNLDIGIKAAGDVEDLYTCLAMIKAGATRIGMNPEDAEGILDEFRKEYGDDVEI